MGVLFMDLFEPADIIIYIQGKGIVLKEKSLLAVNTVSGKIVAYGEEASYITGNEGNIKIISPLRMGAAADYVAAAGLFKCLLNKVWGKKPLIRQPVAVCIPEWITEVEKKAMEEILYQAGAREVLTSCMPLGQLLEKMPGFPGKWNKVKIIIAITKDEPANYIKEQLLSVFNYAAREEISYGKVMEISQEITEKPEL